MRAAHLVAPQISVWKQPGAGGGCALQRPQQVVGDEGRIKIVPTDGACAGAERSVTGMPAPAWVLHAAEGVASSPEKLPEGGVLNQK